MGRIKTLLVASLAVFALLGAGTSAQASLVLTVEVFDVTNTSLGAASALVNTVTQTFIGSPTFTGSASGSFVFGLTSANGKTVLDYGGTIGGGDFDFFVAGKSNSPGTQQLGSLAISYASITNDTGSARKVSISVSDNGFFAPTSPPMINYLTSTSGTSSGGVSLGAFTSHADGNTANPIVFAALGLNKSVGADGTPSAITISSSPFTFDVNYTALLANGTQLVTGGGLATLTSVPEPASLAMMFSALPMVGFAAWRRRRANV